MNELHEHHIISYGWNSIHAAYFMPYGERGLVPARIIEEGRTMHRAIGPTGEILLESSGSFLNLVDLGVQHSPVVGDWCAVDLHAPDRGKIEGVLQRINEFHKPLAHDADANRSESRVVAANIDATAIVQDIKFDFNLRRIERFLALLSADGIPASLVLTKADLIENREAYLAQVQERFGDLRTYIVDSISGCGITELSESLKPRVTLMLVGTSGAGKSTLVNALCNTKVARTAQVRDLDGRGRHTTTSRRMHLLPNGALVLDTPGVRAVGMNSSSSDIQNSFEDIVLLAASCKYSDCTHTGEPGCAVQKAIQHNQLEQDRYLNYLHLMQETVGYEEVLKQSEQKKRGIGRLRYLMRREGTR